MKRIAIPLLCCILIGAVVGCATGSVEPVPETILIPEDEGMTPARMELIFSGLVPAIEGPTGAIRTQIDGINVYLISDPSRDRMRLLVPIADVQGLGPRILNVMLEANFSDTVDARYAISDGRIFATFMHPISSLTPELIESALAQVVSLYRTFGTRFSAEPPAISVPGQGSSWFGPSN